VLVCLYALSSSFGLTFSFMQDVIADSRRKSEKLWRVVSDHKELAALKRRVDDEKTENLHLKKVNAELQ
jgi:hypothetical protein